VYGAGVGACARDGAAAAASDTATTSPAVRTRFDTRFKMFNDKPGERTTGTLLASAGGVRTLLSAAVILSAASPSFAQTPPPAEPPPRWERKAEVSLVATSGNSDTQTVGLGASLVYRPGVWTTEAKAAFVRSETSNVETARSFAADLRQARSLSPRVDLFGRFGFLSNEFAGVDARSTIDGGVGYKLLLGPVHTLRVDGGLGYSHENRVTGEDLSFPLLNAGAGYKWQISKTADFTEAALFTQSLDEGEDWRFGNALALTAAITSVFSLKASHEVKHVHAPVPGFEKTDTLTSVALVAKF
jgi:putative salt-induced outer membrane protein